jgi:hypothetical protein
MSDVYRDQSRRQESSKDRATATATKLQRNVGQSQFETVDISVRQLNSRLHRFPASVPHHKLLGSHTNASSGSVS